MINIKDLNENSFFHLYTEKAHSANVQHFVFMIAFHFENIDYNGVCHKFKDLILNF